ncbi:MAG: phage tail protein [Deltaproteobacteria bacterium]|nr:phage tail protein [Deltaproteobacteria bacterium]
MQIVELPSVSIEVVAATQADARLSLTNRHPGPDEENVPFDWNIALEIVDTGPDGVDPAATQLWVDGVLALDSGVFQPGFTGVDSELVTTADSLRIVIDPVAYFESQATVEVRVVSAVVGETQTLDETYSFIVEDRTAPRVLAARATDQRIVRIGFDEDVQVIDSNGFSFEALDVPAVPISSVSAASQGSVVEVMVNTEMTPDVRYRVTVDGVTDINDNPVLPPYDAAVFTGFRPVRPVNRRFNLWELIPKYNRRIDETGDLRRFIDCLQEVLDLLLVEIDRFPNIWDIERAPETFLDLILQDLGNPFMFDLGELGKRRLAAVLIELFRQKGTAIGIQNAIRFFLGIEVEIVPFTADVMSLGESELGVDWILGPSDRFALYAFNIRVDQALNDTQREQIRAIVNLNKVAHTHFIDLIEPSAPPSLDHWELGISELNINTLLS